MTTIHPSTRVPALLGAAALVAVCAAAGPAPFRPSDVAERVRSEWRAFNARHQDRWSVEWNAVTGTPHRIRGHFLPLPSPVTQQNVEASVRGALKELEPVLQIDGRQLELARAERQPGRAGYRGPETWFVSFRQVYRGIPVNGGSAQVVIRGDRITSVAADVFPRIGVATRPALSRSAALAKVRAELDDGRAEPAATRLVVHPAAAGGRVHYQLAWELTMPLADVGPAVAPPSPGARTVAQWRFLVDATDGRLVEREDLVRDVLADVSGTVTGSVHPRTPADAPEARPLANVEVTGKQGSTVRSDSSDAAGKYRLKWFLPGPVVLKARLAGRRLSVEDEAAPEARLQVLAGAPGTQPLSFAGADPAPADAQTNAFYQLDALQSWFSRGAPFDVLPGPLPLRAHVHAGTCGGSSSAGQIHLGGASGDACSDSALCAGVIAHEYTHRVSTAVYEAMAVDFPYRGEPGAMAEAWSDYFGATYIDESDVGAGCGSGMQRDLDAYDYRFPGSWTGEVHRDGLLLSGALWDLRAALGAPYSDALAMRAMKRVATGFRGYLEALLAEDDDPSFDPSPLANDDPSDGSPNASAVCHAFLDLHGIFHPFCVGHTASPIADISSPEPTRAALFDGASGPVTIHGTVAAGTGSSAVSYVLDWKRWGGADAWSSTGIALAGGGTAAVVEGPLGTLDLAAFEDGFYVLRLTATDSGGGTASMWIRFVVDRGLVAGWPQARGTSFWGTPALADVDPASPGLEVIALGKYGGFNSSLYVWRGDGTSVPGFPLEGIPGSGTAPAVGDVDGDGSLEIVTTSSPGLVNVYSSAGALRPGWPQDTTGAGEWSGAALADLDGDGDLEIVVGSRAGLVWAWHHDGTRVAGWPAATSAEVESTPTVGDADCDGRPEVFVGAVDGTAWGWRADGAALPGWPVTAAATAQVTASGALVDLDGDCDAELVVGTRDLASSGSSLMHAWHHDGSAAAGWPRTFDPVTSPGAYQTTPASTVVADLDGDLRPEVVAMSNDDRIHVWRGDGSPVGGWPPAGIGGDSWEARISSPAVADITGDGRVDVVAEGSNVILGGGYLGSYPFLAGLVHAFAADGSPLAGWPKITTAGDYGSTPAIGDIDGDGKLEVLVASLDGVFAWRTDGAATGPAAREWPTYRGDVRRTGSYGRPDLVVSSLTHAPAGAVAAEPITFTAVVRNEGARWAAPSQLSFRIGGESPPAAIFAVPVLGPGESATFTRVAALPRQAYRSTAVADWDRKICEATDENNELTEDFLVTACRPGTRRVEDCPLPGGGAGRRIRLCTANATWVTSPCLPEKAP